CGCPRTGLPFEALGQALLSNASQEFSHRQNTRHDAKPALLRLADAEGPTLDRTRETEVDRLDRARRALTASDRRELRSAAEVLK
ncbi:MAG: hypothetical protein ACT4TC_23065, partial [Myxococcaceae bacterium]